MKYPIRLLAFQVLSFLLMIGLTNCKFNNKSGSTQKKATKESSLISAKDAVLKLNDKSITFLDVRTPGEISEGKIAGAKEINFRDSDFDKQLNLLDKNHTYIVYCKSGGRSHKTCNKMKELGFTNVKDLDGGYTAYNKLSN